MGGTTGVAMLGLASTLAILCTLCIILRIWSRILVRASRGFWWDDWFAFWAYPLALTQCFFLIYWTTIGLGYHSDDLSNDNRILAFKLIFAGEITYCLESTLIKLSALFFYARVFTNYNNFFFKYTTFSIGAASIAWCIAGVFSSIFQCDPIQAAWLFEEDGRCIDVIKWYLGLAGSAVVLDFAILLLPVQSLLELKMKPRRKTLVLLVFACGYSVTFVTLARVIFMAVHGRKATADITYTGAPLWFLNLLEMCVGLICVCLPSIFSLFKYAYDHGPSALVKTGTSRSHSNC